MHVFDLDGKRVDVTDLKQAIDQANLFKAFTHVDPEFAELDKRSQAYWSDLHDKLINLQKSLL